MKTLRSALSLPLFVLQTVFGVVMFLTAWLGQKHLLMRASRLVGDHFYWPMVVGRRIVAGRPRWEPYDLQIGKQPRTDADRARADAHPNVSRVECFCGQPDCSARGGNLYAWTPPDSEPRPRPDPAAVAVVIGDIGPYVKQVSELESDLLGMRAELNVTTSNYNALMDEHRALLAKVNAVRETYAPTSAH